MTTQKPNPLKVAALRGFICAPAGSLPIEPLADVIAYYTCYDR